VIDSFVMAYRIYMARLYRQDGYDMVDFTPVGMFGHFDFKIKAANT